MYNRGVKLLALLFALCSFGCGTLSPELHAASEAGRAVACAVCGVTSPGPREQAETYSAALRELALVLADVARSKGHEEQVARLLEALAADNERNREAFERLLQLAQGGPK